MEKQVLVVIQYYFYRKCIRNLALITRRLFLVGFFSAGAASQEYVTLCTILLIAEVQPTSFAIQGFEFLQKLPRFRRCSFPPLTPYLDLPRIPSSTHYHVPSRLRSRLPCQVASVLTNNSHPDSTHRTERYGLYVQ